VCTGKQNDCLRVLAAGKLPLQVENTDATVTVVNPALTKAVLLEINGMATQTPMEVTLAGGRLSVILPPKAM
jgi:hypothetical protein